MKHAFSTDGKKKSEPDRALIGRVRAALILRGTTLAQWADRRGCSRGCLHNAISGRRAGRRSAALRTELLKDLGMENGDHGGKATPGKRARQ